jgi:hypothetical protein
MRTKILLVLIAFTFLQIRIECRNLYGNSFQPDSIKKTNAGMIESEEQLISDFITRSAEKYGNPSSLNVVINNLIGGKKNFLKDLNLRFNNQQCGDVTFLGLNYSYQKNVTANSFSESEMNSSGLSFSVATEGNLVLGNLENPNDFLKSRVSFHYYHNSSGVEKASDQLQRKKTDLEITLSEYEDKTEMKCSPEYKEYMSVYSQFLKTQLYWDFNLNASIESNHTFLKKQFVYSAQLGVDIKAWNMYSELSKLNIFDWPFAALRWLNGTDEELCPLGSTIPTMLFDIALVDPVKDEMRKLLNLTKPYPRFGFETAFKTLVSDVSGERIFFTADFRYFKELGAKEIIKILNMDENFYFVAALIQDDGFYISYAYGNLPFDRKKDAVYSIGFNFKF